MSSQIIVTNGGEGLEFSDPLDDSDTSVFSLSGDADKFLNLKLTFKCGYRVVTFFQTRNRRSNSIFKQVLPPIIIHALSLKRLRSQDRKTIL